MVILLSEKPFKKNNLFIPTAVPAWISEILSPTKIDFEKSI
jgi:hypothetical protein